MAIPLALLVALFAGVSDFLGAIGSRTAPAMAISAGAHAVGFVMMVGLGIIVGGSPTTADLWWGIAAGFGSAVGLTAIYTGYAKSRIAIVAPVVGVGSVSVPVLWSAVDGDTLAGQAWYGVALGVLAIFLVSLSSGEGRGSVPTALGYGLVGASGLGFLLVAFGQSSEDSGIWIVAPSRASGLAMLVVMLRVSRTPMRLPKGLWPVIVPVAALSSLANAAYAVAVREGSLASVAVVSSMFPAITILLAWWVWKERIRRVQLGGIAVAMLAVGLIAAS